MRSSSTLLIVAAAAFGACTMSVELVAVRLLAPWFGTSTFVWSHVIGVILLALALGYFAGSLFASSPRALARMTWIAIVAAAWIAWLPKLARPVCTWFMDERLAIQDAPGLWSWGSLAAAIILFVPAAALLGATTPVLVELVQRAQGSSAGRAGGAVLASSTIGGLAGLFATTHVLVPRVGVGWTCAAASALLVVALLALIGSGGVLERSVKTAAMFVVGFGAWTTGLAFARVELPPAPAPMRLLETRESPYQLLRVVEDTSVEPAMRFLQVNDARELFQSAWRAETGLLGPGYYYDYFALPAWWAKSSGTWKVLALGAGAGTAFRVLEGASPAGLDVEYTGVEIDPQVVELARRWFDADEVATRWIVDRDARAALRTLPRDFDLVIVDAYQNDLEIPTHLATLEFFREVREHLAPGGWLTINVGAFDAEDPMVVGLGRTLARAFERDALAVRVPAAMNFVLYVRNGLDVPTPTSAEWHVAGSVGDALLPALGLPGAVASLRDEASFEPWTDAHSPIELAQSRSLERRLEHHR